MQKSIATFWPPFPPQRLRRPVIFWNHPLPFKTYLTALQSGKTIALKERLPCPWPVSKLPGPSVSPPSLFSESSLSKGVADGCRLQKGWGKIAKLGYSWPSVSTCGSRMVASKLQKHFDTHWPGEDDYRPASFFPNGLVEPKVLVPKECAEGCRM